MCFDEISAVPWYWWYLGTGPLLVVLAVVLLPADCFLLLPGIRVASETWLPIATEYLQQISGDTWGLMNVRLLLLTEIAWHCTNWGYCCLCTVW